MLVERRLCLVRLVVIVWSRELVGLLMIIELVNRAQVLLYVLAVVVCVVRLSRTTLAVVLTLTRRAAKLRWMT